MSFSMKVIGCDSKLIESSMTSLKHRDIHSF